MVSYSQLLNMDTSKLTSAAESAGGLSGTLSGRAAEVGSKAQIPGGMWSGKDATAASTLLAEQPSPLYDASDAFRKGRAALEDLVDGVQAAKARLHDAKDLIAGTGITIGADGSVTTPVVESAAVAEHNARIAKQAREIIEEALRKATEADENAVAAIKAADVNVSANDIPNGDKDSAQDVKKWWDSLSPVEQQAYIQKHSKEIGNLDGIPAEDRHQANMKNLRDEIASGNAEPGAQKLLDRIENSWKGPESDRIHLLGFDPNGDADSKIIAAIGNPDTADNTGVYVPGTGTDMANIGGSLDSMNNLQNQAGGNTSTMVWLGYDAPDDVFPDAVGGGYARDGAEDLRDFTRGLDATHTGADGNTSVIGHSYGATVVGTADSLGEQDGNDGLVTDDVVAVGSPGMGYESSGRQGFIDGPLVDDTSDMHTDDDHVWVGASTNDPVSYTGVHGQDPTAYSFGAERFDTDGSSGHSEYFKPGSSSLVNQGRILTGDYDNVSDAWPRVG